MTEGRAALMAGSLASVFIMMLSWDVLSVEGMCPSTGVAVGGGWGPAVGLGV